ncbi:hypothetical protein CTheo_8237 [Ceratobasidium theobromae]|uniref:Uncharacterized protein n=1 Tax=Ceratobasidium theobromae TaxID=1582974 RepID=A0A5N5QA96_9AGAM|nr:hypothetical protein CTheo_8237 [Ceratobasidium theobromae]
MAETNSTGTWSLGGIKDALLGGDKEKVAHGEKQQATVNAALREETKLKEERGEDTGGWRQKIKEMMDDDDSLKEEIKKLETELAEIKADEADDTWTEKVTISCSALVDCPCKEIGRHSPLRPLRVVCVFKAGLFDKLLDKYQGFSLELSWIGPNLDSCERSFNRINSRAWGLLAARFNGSQEAHKARIIQIETRIAELKKQEAEKQEGWKGKLKDIFDGEDDEGKERIKQEVNKEALWRDKLGEHLFGTPKAEPKKEEGFSLGSKASRELNELAGGGKKSEEKEDKLDKLVDLYQEHVLKEGPQDNENAFEQAKDEQISDAIRSGFKMVTGKDIPMRDKAH